MSVGRLETVWSVTGGGAGMTVMHGAVEEGTFTAANATSVLTAIRTAFAGFSGRLPNDVTLSWPGPIDIFDLSGTLIDSRSLATTVSSLSGTSAGVYSAPSGARVDWETGAILGGRRLRGRSYIVPIAGDQYDADGTIASDFITTVGPLFTTMRTALAAAGAALVVWSRKNAEMELVVGQTIKDKAAILRSRRD